jgi:diacylglycerol kinase family enzyme
VRLLLIGNPSASSVTPRAQVVIAKALAADHDVTVATTSRRGHATRLAQGAAADGVEVVVALGGDGTLNEVANGLAGSATALGVLPGGSTNVFARTIGMVNDPIEATGALLGALGSGRGAGPDGPVEPSLRRIGLGAVNGRYFLFHVGIGLDAEVVRLVERRGQLKRWAGHPLFAWSGVQAWSRTYDRSRPRFAVRHPDGTVVDDALFGLCQNADPYTFVGNRPLATNPHASLDRPLAMLTFRDLDLVPTLCYLAEALLGGDRLVRDKRVVERHDLDRVTVSGHGPVPYQVDGDYLGETDRLDIVWVPDILTLVLPEARRAN